MEDKKLIYISGKITGKKNFEKSFDDAEKILESTGIYNPVNPVTLSELTVDKTYKGFLIMDIMSLVNCDAVYMLKGWRKSKGARLEHHIAKTLGLEIIYQKKV